MFRHVDWHLAADLAHLVTPVRVVHQVTLQELFGATRGSAHFASERRVVRTFCDWLATSCTLGLLKNNM